MVKDADSIDEVSKRFASFMQPAADGSIPVVGHNVGFDKKFIDKAYSDSGISADYDYVDTLALSRDEMPNSKNHKLSTIARDLDIEQEEDHRALADARTAGRVYSVLNKRR